MKWEAFKEKVETMRDQAKAFENAYNGIKGSIENQEGIREVLKAFPQTAIIQAKKERERLITARNSAITEKRTYTLVSWLFIFENSNDI